MKYRKLIITILVVLTAVFLLDWWFTRQYQKDNLYKTQWIIQKEKQQYDYAVLGASHAYMGFDIALADSLLGMKGINISLDGSHIGTQSVLADIFYNRNENKTRYLFLCVDNPLLANSEMLADIADGRMIPYLNYDEVFSFYKNYGKKWYFDRYIPFWKYAEYNYYWGPHIFANTYFNYMKQDFDSSTGSRYEYRNIYDNSDSTLAVVDFKDSAARYLYLNKVVDICKKKNIQPVLFSFPLTRADTSAQAAKNVASFTSYWKNKGIDYVYLGDYLNYQFENFADKGHLNKRGAEKSTAKLIEAIKNNHLLH